MANDASLVSVGKPKVAGAVFAAVAGTAAPTDSTTALPAAFKPLGYVSDDGLTNPVDTDKEEIKEWGGTTVLTVRTSYTETFEFTLIQALDKNVLAEVFGDDNVTETGGVQTVAHSNAELPHRVYVFDVALNDGSIKRIVVPDAQVTERDDIEYKNDSAIGYKLTLSAYADANGKTVFEYRAVPSGS